GYIKSAVHRVVRPPADQAHCERLGLFYFVRPGDSVPMVPVPSPVLMREGLLTEADRVPQEGQVTAAGEEHHNYMIDERVHWNLNLEYVRARVKNVHDRKQTRIADQNAEGLFKVKNLAVQNYYV
ncbi:hypothetical protein C0993_001862, partial [Termitomyces sp. T159_Od127]